MVNRPDQPNSQEGCCISCGFLGKFISGENIPPPRIIEIIFEERASGHLKSNGFVPYVGLTETSPICHRQEINIHSEFVQVRRNSSNSEEAYRKIFYKERQCPKWFEYTPGFSPMEHLQEFKMLELEQRRKEFEQRMEQDRRDFDFKIAESNKSFQMELAESNKQIQHDLDARNRKLQYWITSLVVFIALVEIGVTVLQLAYPDGFPWLMRYLPQEVLPLKIPGGF